MATEAKKTKTLIDLLKAAGFSKVRKINERVIHASLGNDTADGGTSFGKAHASFLQGACKHPELQGCFAYPAVPETVLIVHRKAGETPAVPEPETLNSETGTEEPATAEAKADKS